MPNNIIRTGTGSISAARPVALVGRFEVIFVPLATAVCEHLASVLILMIADA